VVGTADGGFADTVVAPGSFRKVIGHTLSGGPPEQLVLLADGRFMWLTWSGVTPSLSGAVDGGCLDLAIGPGERIGCVSAAGFATYAPDGGFTTAALTGPTEVVRAPVSLPDGGVTLGFLISTGAGVAQAWEPDAGLQPLSWSLRHLWPGQLGPARTQVISAFSPGLNTTGEATLFMRDDQARLQPIVRSDGGSFALGPAQFWVLGAATYLLAPSANSLDDYALDDAGVASFTSKVTDLVPGSSVVFLGQSSAVIAGTSDPSRSLLFISSP
jgi:hypothetical protein